MKFKKVIFIFVATGSIVAASPSPHRHHHKHIEKRTPETKIITVNEYEIGGRPATLEEVCAGLKAKTLKVPDGGTVPQCSDDGSPVQHAYAYGGQKGHGDHNKHHGGHKGHGQSQQQASSSSLIVVSSVTPVAPVASSSKSYVESSTPAPSVSSSSTPVSSSPAEKQSSPAEKPSSPSTGTSDSQDGQGVDREFPDCEIDCSQFPSDYGPIAIDWMKIGGWSGIQYPTIQGNVITRIDTAVPGGKNCVPGAMCSYACPPGYQKSQWPLAQGSTGESVGGLLCDNQGKLKLTNSGLSNRLCIKGTGGVQVQNDLKGSDNVAICRTDYPGTESETVPLDTQPGSLNELTCPDSKNYFRHEGSSTTAQYYVNMKGIAKEDACMWSQDGSHMGNWAPSYFGVGRDVNGDTWLSISSTIQNNPTDYKCLDYTVELEGDLSDKCRLKDGKYCSGSNYETCNETGCTVMLLSGQGKYVLTPS